MNSITSTLAKQMQSERSLSRCTKWTSKLTVRFSQHYCSKFILISALIFLHSSSLFQYEKELWRHICFCYSTCFCYYRKHPNNDNKIYPLPSYACFQQHFHDWFLVTDAIQMWRNLNQHHYYLLFDTIQMWRNLNKHHYYLIQFRCGETWINTTIIWFT